MVQVLSSRVLVRPTDPRRSLVFYRDVLGLEIYREFATGDHGERGTVFFLGGGFLEVSGRSVPPETPAAPGLQLWMQVPDAEEAHRQLAERGADILRAPVREPWGLIEMWIQDPDGLQIAMVEVPADHPLRFRD